MSRSKVTVQKLQGGLGRRATNTDMISGLCMNGIATANLDLGTTYELRSEQDARGYGLDEAYDEANSVLVFHHISRVFLRNPSAILFIMLVPQTVTLTEMVDKDNSYLAKLLREKTGQVVQWAVARNPAVNYTPTLQNGLDADVVTVISKAKELIEFEETKFRYADGFIEGRSFNGTATGALDLRTLDAEGVSVVIGADKEISETKAIYNGYAAVGDALGICSLAAVSQNIGELTEAFNLTNSNAGAFLRAGLSSNAAIGTYSDTDLDTLQTKGYIFAESTEVNQGRVGYWFNDSHCCVAIDSDYAYKENNRTIKKAIKLARLSIVPRLKGRIYVNPDTGQIQRTDAKDIETTLKTAIEPMLADGDISGGIDAYVDPEQNILATSLIECELTFVPVAIGRQITLKIGFKNPLKNV